MPVLPVRTRRGMVLALYGDVVLLAGILVFLVTRNPSALVVAVALAGLVAFASLAALRAGRHELGALHHRLVAWGLALFGVAALAYVLTFLGLTTTFPERGQLATFRISLFLLAAGLVAENASGIAFLWTASDARARRLLGGQAVLVLLLLVPLVWHGLLVINGFVERSGGVAVNPAEARSYLRDFVNSVLADFAIAFVLARLPGLVALWGTIDRLASLEHPADGVAA